MNLLTGPAASIQAVVGFGAIVAVVSGLAIAAVPAAARATGKDDASAKALGRRFAIGLCAWLVLTWLAATSGVLTRWDLTPPPLMPMVAVAVIGSVVLAFSKLGGMLATGLPVAWLVGFHAFRVPLELILNQLSFDGVLPVQMTFHGMNFDIVTGLTAIVVALWAAFAPLPRAVLLLWNLLGLTLLLVIVSIAVMSMPAPLRVFMNEPANTIVATSPFMWLPLVLVQAAWLGHLLVFRRLASGKP